MARAPALAGLLALGLAAPAAARDCVAGEGMQGVRVPAAGTAEVADGAAFVRRLDNGWHLALIPDAYGWALRVYDRAPGPGAVDLTAVTPPFRFAPNPRDIHGWHFRDAANAGPNTGEVNAPQRLRRFLLAPGLAGTGGFKPPAGPAPAIEAEGAGWLEIAGFMLDPPAPARRARMTRLRFSACLTWPAGAGAADETWAEMFGACGLDPDRYAPSGALAPATLSGDFDGDDALDTAAPVADAATGNAALAICRAGTWLDLIAADAGALRPGLLDQVEAWRVLPRDHGPLGYVDESPWPEADGDVIVLERIEKEAVLVFRAGGGWVSRQVYRMVEP